MVQSYFPRENEFKLIDGQFYEGQKFGYYKESRWDGTSFEGKHIDNESVGFLKRNFVNPETGNFEKYIVKDDRHYWARVYKIEQA